MSNTTNAPTSSGVSSGGSSGPVVAPTPSSGGGVSPTDILNALNTILGKVNLRQVFNYKTLQFWVTLAGIAAVVMGTLNVGNSLSSAAQTAIITVGGLVVTLVTGKAVTSVPLPTALAMAYQHAQVTAGAEQRTFGAVSNEGYYPLGTASGSVTSPVTLNVSPGGAVTVATGYVSPGTTNEGNVVAPGGDVGTWQGPYSGGNAENYNPLSPTSPLPNQSGDNSNEGTGGPAVTPTQGPYNTSASTEPAGSYVQPAVPQANPDEENPTEFTRAAKPPTAGVAKVEKAASRARRARKQAAESNEAPPRRIVNSPTAVPDQVHSFTQG